MSAPDHQHDPRTARLLEAPVLTTMLSLAAPTTLIMLTQTAVGLLEVYFLSRLGTDVLAGVSEVFPLVALVTAVSTGAVGGGIVSAIARTLGQGRRQDAGDLVWHALAIGGVLGALTTSLLWAFGTSFYLAMGASGASLQAAQTYSAVIFGGAVFIWTSNALMACVRGSGNLILPMQVVCGGALLLVPVSYLLIFGLGPFQGLGVAGGAAALLVYYATGTAIYAVHLWSHKGVLRPSREMPRLSSHRALEILRVGGLSTIVAATTNLTIAVTTGFVGAHGAAAVAGFGAGARLEFFLVPLAFGIGGPAAILIGTNLGAGNRARALRAAWLSVGIAAVAAELVGVAAATYPQAWIGAFTRDPAAIMAGVAYLRTTGPFFGFFGAGFALYCVAQGVGRMSLPVIGAFVRSGIAIGGGSLASTLPGIFLSVGLGMVAFGVIGSLTLLFRIGFEAHKVSVDKTEGRTVRSQERSTASDVGTIPER